MKSPISFEQFTKNPVAAIAFLALGVIGYLYVDMMSIHEDQLENLEEQKLCSSNFRRTFL